MKNTFALEYLDEQGFPKEYKHQADSLPDFLNDFVAAHGNRKVSFIELADGAFVSDLISLSTPAVPTGLVSGVITSTSIVFTHDLIDGAAFYEYAIGTDGAVQYTIPPTTITGLTTGTGYAIKVRSANDHGVSAWSTPVTMTTI